jgi:hypothetical protein
MIASAAEFPGRPRLRPHGGPAPSRRYERRRPKKTPLHRIVSENLESWLEWRDRAERPVAAYIEEELRGYLECGFLCFGFARALCTGCRTGFVVVFSCKGRVVCSARLSRVRQLWEPLAFPSAARLDGAMDGNPVRHGICASRCWNLGKMRGVARRLGPRYRSAHGQPEAPRDLR